MNKAVVMREGPQFRIVITLGYIFGLRIRPSSYVYMGHWSSGCWSELHNDSELFLKESVNFVFVIFVNAQLCEMCMFPVDW